MSRRVPPVAWLLGATLVSGGSGYLVTWLVAGRLGAIDYAAFAAFWSALYLLIGALGGVQQEFSRASTPTNGEATRTSGSGRVWRFAAVAAALVAVVALLLGLLTGPALFGDSAGSFVVPMIVGPAFYLVVAVVVGSFYGLSLWRAIAALMAGDGLVRLLLVIVVLIVGPTPSLLAWATVAPFPLAVLLAAPYAIRALRGVTLDVPDRALAANSGKAVLGALSTAVLISGFPFLLALTTASGAETTTVAAITLFLMLTRAPLVIPFLSLQSYLVVRFRGAGVGRLVLIEGAIVAGAAVLGLLAAVIGPPIVEAVFGSDFALAGWLVGVIVFSSGLVAALCVSGAAAIARSALGRFALGWAAAAVLSLAGLLLPLPVEPRTALALVIGPLVGLIVHLLPSRTPSRRVPAPASEPVRG